MGLNILIVDDSAVMRSMIRKTMELSGLPLGEVHQAANGRTIVVSTEGSRTRIGRLERWGVKFIHKPFSPEMIRDAVREVLGNEVAHGSGAE